MIFSRLACKVSSPETMFENNLSKTHIHRCASHFWTRYFTYKRRENIARDLFRVIKDDNHILHSLLPKREITSMAVSNSYPYKIPITKVSRYGRGFIPYCIAKGFKYLWSQSILFVIVLFHSYLLSPCSIMALFILQG